MPIFERTDANHKESSVQSNVAAFFEDAYAHHEVAGATMAVGMLAMTRGKSGAGLLTAELAASGAAKGAAVAVEAGGAKLAAEAMAHPGAMRNLLLDGASHIEAPAARGMALLQMKVGLPRNMDAATTTKLAEGVMAKDSAAVGSVMDDIFNGTSYEAMSRRFGG
ncbi:MAG: hypothetical protein Q8T09_14630 [Candidatus Melainabacteria bacterium]|nr:hypothetical protein [Candidatus Melainabacteria bacterium]